MHIFSGEKLDESTLTHALQKAAISQHLELVDFCAAEHVLVPTSLLSRAMAAAPHYHIFVEVERSREGGMGGGVGRWLGGEGSRKRLSDSEKATFDENLRTASQVYDSYRAKGAIGALQVHEVPAGRLCMGTGVGVGCGEGEGVGVGVRVDVGGCSGEFERARERWDDCESRGVVACVEAKTATNDLHTQLKCRQV